MHKKRSRFSPPYKLPVQQAYQFLELFSPDYRSVLQLYNLEHYSEIYAFKIQLKGVISLAAVNPRGLK